jgi:hypothetical protein
VLGVALLLACGGRRQLDVGSDSRGNTTGTRDAGGPVLDGKGVCLKPCPAAAADGGGSALADGATTTTVLSPLNGDWHGTFELYQFSDGSSAIAMKLALQSDGTVKGTVVLGNSPPPPPATDPDVGYPAHPPGATWLDWLLKYDEYTPPFFQEGFSYSAQETTFDGVRLQIAIASGELWKDWCRLQTQRYVNPTHWVNGTVPRDPTHQWYGGFVTDPPAWGACALEPDWRTRVWPAPSGACEDYTFDSNDNQDVLLASFDCGAIATSNYCSCTECGCAADLRPELDPYAPAAAGLFLDLQLSGDRLDGNTFNGSTDPPPHIAMLEQTETCTNGSYEIRGHNVHLTRGP